MDVPPGPMDVPEAAAVRAVAQSSVSRPSITAAETAVVCYLREHKDVAKTYGIKKVDGNTSVGSMLVQTLEEQGMGVEWYERLPNDAPKEPATKKWASYIKNANKRPRSGLKPLTERPTIAPPDKAAIARHHGRLPRSFFPLLAKLAKSRMKRRFTSCGNRIGAPAAVALVERDQLVDFVERKLRCECGARLRYCKAASHQVAACAKWSFVCEKCDGKKGSCKPRELLTSKPMHGDDYELNSQLNYAIVTCALSFARMLPFFAVMGMARISDNDHYKFKQEVRSAWHPPGPHPTGPHPTGPHPTGPHSVGPSPDPTAHGSARLPPHRSSRSSPPWPSARWCVRMPRT
jgi:hypothetical protein